MLRLNGILVLLLFFGVGLNAQKSRYPQGYFRWPLDLRPEIVANLGELRSNHWHMGLDIRTAQSVNQRVYAAADGFISYIGIRPLSFGRFIIIQHPNGFSTLYAHLNDFAPAIEKYVTEQQYKQESWAVELTLKPEQFPVKKGSFISFSGTTGGSQGPHVHFEIRETATGKCLNPLLFGMPLKDAVKPSIVKLAMYDRTQGIYNSKPQLFAIRSTAATGPVLTAGKLIKTANPKLSFAIQAFDQISGSANRDGIFAADLYLDGRKLIRYEIDSLGYDETRYMNAHIDYSLDFNGGVYLQHLSRLPGNRSSVYHPREADGVIELSDNDVHDVKIVVHDAYGNSNSLAFQLQYDRSLTAVQRIESSSTPFIPNYVNLVEKPDFEAYLPEDALYDSTLSFYYRTTPAGTNAVSAMHQLNDPSVPVQSPIRIRLKPDAVPYEWRDKVIIERSYRGSRNLRKGEWQGDWVQAEFTDFGFYRAYVDQNPPAVPNIGTGDTINMAGKKSIAITPSDNFGIRSFRAELNGKWIRFTNDKARTWIYSFDERCPYGVHHLKVWVTDLAGNETVKEWWFRRSAYKPPVRKTTKKAPVRKTSSTRKK